MKLNKMFILLLSAVSLQTAFAQMPNPLWLFRDSIQPDERYYYQMGFCDTQAINSGCFDPVDTGDNYDNNYINFDYQFTDGYAGYKMFWDSWMTLWDATQYSAMCLVHKGPLPGHKVKIFCGMHSADGRSVGWQLLGEFKSSTVWKKENIPFPNDFGNKSTFSELRILIYNDSGVTNPASGPGNLKIDDIALIKGSLHLATPALSSPANFSTINGTSGVLFSWRPSDSAQSYEVQVSRFSYIDSFQTIIDSTLSVTQLKMEPYLSAETTEFNWRVRAKNPIDSSEWSTFWSFTSDPLTRHLATPALSSPVNFSTINGTVGILLSWRPSDSAQSYEVQVSRFSDTGGFQTIIDSTLSVTQLKMDSYLSAKTAQFNWRVRAKNPIDSSEWSTFWSFTSDPSARVLFSYSENASQLSATQKAGSAMISVGLPSTCAIGTITILNISGKKLAERTFSGPGLHTLVFPNIPAGMHFLRLNAGGKTIMRKALCF